MFEKTKINEKEAGSAHFVKKETFCRWQQMSSALLTIYLGGDSLRLKSPLCVLTSFAILSVKTNSILVFCLFLVSVKFNDSCLQSDALSSVHAGEVTQ